jgi:hypothetical protein
MYRTLIFPACPEDLMMEIGLLMNPLSFWQFGSERGSFTIPPVKSTVATVWRTPERLPVGRWNKPLRKAGQNSAAGLAHFLFQ